MSTGLGADARAAFHRFRRRARALGTISSSFNALAVGATNAYGAALAQPAPEAWASFVGRTASLVRRANEFDGILVLDVAEREALDFFEAIVRENADLLQGCLTTATTSAVEPLTAVYA